MSGLPSLPGHRLELALVRRLNIIVAEIAKQRRLLREINDPDMNQYREPLVNVLNLADRVLPGTDPEPTTKIAEQLCGLLSLTRGIEIPPADLETGEESFDLDRLIGAQGRMIMTLANALDAAHAMGLDPPDPALPGDLPGNVPRFGNEDLLHEIATGLERVAEEMIALENAKADPSSIRSQAGLIEFYLGAMRIQIDLARLQLTVGKRTIDFAALSRASRSMAELTADLLATLTGWASLVSNTVIRISRSVSKAVRQVARGIGGTIRTIASRTRPVPSLVPAGRPPLDVPILIYIMSQIEDRDIAIEIAEGLNRRGLSCVRDMHEDRAITAEELRQDMEMCVRDSTASLMLLSDRESSRMWARGTFRLVSKVRIGAQEPGKKLVIFYVGHREYSMAHPEMSIGIDSSWMLDGSTERDAALDKFVALLTN